jgi:hypothetical protein
MKKLLLSGVALAVCLSAFAQDAARKAQEKLPASIANLRLERERPVDAISPLREINSTTSATSKTSGVEVVIGTTEYDLQTNYGTAGNRVKVHGDGTVSAVWTRGITGPSYPDRGTGYNYWDGTNWGPSPTMRIESARTGWPNVSGNANKEYVVNHAGNYTTNFIHRNTKGTGAWTEDSAGILVTWPRFVAGGTNNSTIHVIGNDNNGVDYDMLYSRSEDDGATWNQVNVKLPDIDVTYYESAVDGYDIDARGDVVAIVMGGWTENLTLWKSTDNGTTWTTTVISEFPLAPYDYAASGSVTDVDGDGIIDTVFCADSGPSVVIDSQGGVHVACGGMRVLDDDTTAGGSYSYFPGTDGLYYWNESMGPNTLLNNLIAEIADRDGNGTIDIEASIALYQCSLTGMPGIGVDAQDNVHLVYSSLQELTTNGASVDPQSYRNAYYMYSTDGGSTWSTPATVEESDFDEQVFTAMGKRVTNNTVHIIYHKDGEPGTQIGGDADPPSLNEVIYNGVTNPTVGINEIAYGDVKAVVYPNPVSDVLNVDYTFDAPETFTVQLVNALGQVVHSEMVRGVSGINNIRIPVNNYSTGVYMLNTTIGDNVYSERIIVQ